MRAYRTLNLIKLKRLQPVVESRLYCQIAKNISGQRVGKTCFP